MMSAISVPLWSVVGEYHRSSCAFMSPAMIVLFSVVRYVNVFLMSSVFGAVVWICGIPWWYVYVCDV